jgi:hypothetical protein
MRHPRRAFLHIALAGAALLLSSLTVCAGSPAFAAPVTSKAASKWAGTYESDPPKEGTPGGAMTLSLGTDGSATVSQDFGKGESTYFGHWNDSGNGVVVTFDADAGKPAPPPMSFASSHDGLQATTWDHAAWGKLTPPVMKKGAGNWHKGQHRF